MWRPHPSPAALANEDLAAVLQCLVRGDVARLEGAPTPLFLRDDWEQVVESMPVFNGDGPVPAEAPEDPVDVSSDDSSEEEEGGEREKGPDSEATDGESRAPLPRRRSRVLRLSPSDDDEDDDEQGGGSLPPIPKKDRTGLIPFGLPRPRGVPQTHLPLPSFPRLTLPAGFQASNLAGGRLSSLRTTRKCSILVFISCSASEA